MMGSRPSRTAHLAQGGETPLAAKGRDQQRSWFCKPWAAGG